MASPLLTADLSDHLLALIRAGETVIDGMEVGPWFSPQHIVEYRQSLPRLPFYFHGGDLMEGVGVLPYTKSRMAAYLRATASPWLSMHITMGLPGTVWLMRRWGVRLRLPEPERTTRRFIRQVRSLERSIRVPVILENDEPLPFRATDFEVLPQTVTQVLEATGCRLLLDIAHARLSAELLGMDLRDYLHGLPLSLVAQIHLSGARRRGDRLFDAHEPLQERDYELLEWLLGRTRPEVITLEYIREKDALREQLVYLRGILNARAYAG